MHFDFMERKKILIDCREMQVIKMDRGGMTLRGIGRIMTPLATATRSL